MKTSSMNEIVYLYLILKLITLHIERIDLAFRLMYKELQSYLKCVDFNVIEL